MLRAVTAAGFSEVVFLEFGIDGSEPCRPAGSTNVTGQNANVVRAPRLVLRRGVTGSLDLYHWWDEARLAKAPKRRTVTVQLMTADLSEAVLTWHFRGARPVCLSNAPANDGRRQRWREQ